MYPIKKSANMHITLFRSITMFCETDNILQNIPQMETKCGEYSAKYCQSHITLLRICIMLCTSDDHNKYKGGPIFKLVLQMFHRRFANATCELLLCESNWQKLENMENKPNNIRIPYQKWRGRELLHTSVDVFYPT